MEEQQSVKPNTTAQQDLTLEGQRNINLIWEFTQASISIAVTGAVIYCSVIGKINSEISNAFFLIVGFYFSRTNHAAIGGIGNKPVQVYEGR